MGGDRCNGRIAICPVRRGDFQLHQLVVSQRSFQFREKTCGNSRGTEPAHRTERMRKTTQVLFVFLREFVRGCDHGRRV
jgi:hypothetical protein